jgi:hypothetical protein
MVVSKLKYFIMQGVEFYQYFEKFPEINKSFKGIFSIDTLPRRIKYRTFCICNTDTQNGTGKHWICFIKTDKSDIECFDSLGISSDKKELLIKHCNFKGKHLKFNSNQFQKNDSITCGLFCVYFLIERYF